MGSGPRLYFKMCIENQEIPPHGHLLFVSGESDLSSIPIFSKVFGIWLVKFMFSDGEINLAELAFLFDSVNESKLPKSSENEDIKVIEEALKDLSDTNLQSLTVMLAAHLCQRG